MEEENKTVALLKKELPQLKAIIALNSRQGADVQTMALEELEHLKSVALTKPEIYECEPVTVIMALKAVLKQNLTLDPYQGLVYIKTQSVNVGTKASPSYRKGLVIEPTANGLISINRQCGRILDVDRPEVKFGANGKVTSVIAKFLKPTFDEKGQPATRWQTTEYDESEFKRWMVYSHRQNSRGKQDANGETLNYANALYRSHNGGIDPEFARAKAIRHALKKQGTNMNERPSLQAPIIKSVIEPSAATQESADEYQSYEEVIAPVKQEEVITVPNSNEL